MLRAGGALHAAQPRQRPGAHAIERELRVLRALAGSGVPVPHAPCLEEDVGILGTPFYVMERLEGREFSACTFPGIAEADRRQIYLEMARRLGAALQRKPCSAHC